MTIGINKRTSRFAAALVALAAAGSGCAPESPRSEATTARSPAPTPAGVAPPASAAPMGAQANVEPRFELCWRAAGTLAALDRSLPEDLWDAVPDEKGPAKAPKAVAAARGYASEARKVLRPRELPPAVAPGMPEVAGGLDRAALQLIEATQAYDTAVAAVGARGVSLATRSRTTARTQRQEAAESLRIALKAAQRGGLLGEYRVDEDGTVWRCQEGKWTEAATTRTGDPCPSTSTPSPDKAEP